MVPKFLFISKLWSVKTEGIGKDSMTATQGMLKILAESKCFLYSRGMILSGPFLEVISVNSRSILAAFLASDLRLEGIGLFTVKHERNKLKSV